MTQQRDCPAKPTFAFGKDCSFGAGDDRIRAGSGRDVVHGGDDNGDIDGLAGNDVLFSGIGHDLLWGDAGARAMVGGGCVFLHDYGLLFNATNDVFRRAA